MRVFFFLSQMFLCVEWCCFASVFLAFFFVFCLFVCFLLLFFCVFVLLHTRKTGTLCDFSRFWRHIFCAHDWTVDFRSRVFTRTSRDMWRLRQRSSLTILGLFAHEYSSKKKDIWVSSRILHWMFFIVWRWDVHICAWWSWCISSEIFFFGFSLFFLSVSHHFFFVLLFFFFFFFIPKETKSACVSTTTHKRTHKRKNNTNERKSIDQIIIKNQKCKARDTRTCSSANARAGKTWGNRTWPQFKRWRTSWRAV